MKISSEKQENSTVLLTIEVESEQVEQALQKTARKLAQKTNIPGFRRGKAPYHIVLQTFGRASLLEEAAEDITQEAFKQALEDLKIEPYAQAKVVDMQLEPMVIKLHVPVAPTVDLGDYRQLRLEVPPVVVADEDTEKAIAGLRDQHATWAPATRGATWGDRVTLTYSRNQAKPSDPVDIVLKEDSQYPMPGFHSRLIDAVAGQQLTFSLTYPADWHDESLRGQIQDFQVQVTEIKGKELPSLEELPALIGDYDDLDALKADVVKDLTEREQQRIDSELLRKAIDTLIEQAQIEYPPEAEEEELDRLLDRQDTRLMQQGLNLESYLNVLKMTKEAYREQQRPTAIKALKTGLILGELAKREDLEIEQEELVTELNRRSDEAERFLEAQAANEMNEMLASAAGQSFVLSEMMADKAYARLLSIVKGEAPEPPPAEADNETEPAA